MARKNNFDFDVFISYSHKNKKWVRNVLLPRLEKANLKVFIDFRDFEIGAASVKEMERGVTRSRKTVVVLTPEYLKSSWSEFEILMTQNLSPANKDKRIVPILRKPCKLPVSISYMNYVSLTNARADQDEWERLVQFLGGEWSTQKILIVDDTPDVRATIGGLLEDKGYEVCVSEDEDGAFGILQSENIHFAIIDIRLHRSPDDESGLKLAQAIHALAPHIQTIILSGSTKPAHIISAFTDFGVMRYIVKEHGWEIQLMKAIKDLSLKAEKK